MDLFEQYEREYIRSTNVIRERQNRLSELSGEKRKNAIYETERMIDDAKQLISNMEQALKSSTRERQRRNEPKIKGYEAELSRILRDLQSSASSSLGPAGPSSNRFGRSDDDDSIRNNQNYRLQMLEAHSTLENTNDRLVNANRIAVETQYIGEGVLTDLHTQRETLEKAQQNLYTIDDNMTRSRKILGAMSRRIATNKIILAFIILLLLIGNGLIIYFKWINPLVKGKKKD